MSKNNNNKSPQTILMSSNSQPTKQSNFLYKIQSKPYKVT